MSNTPLTIAIESLSVVADPNDIVRFGDNISDVVRDFHVCGWLQHARIRKGSPNCGSMALQRIMEKPVPQGKTVCWTYVLHAEQIASTRRTRDNPRMKIASLNDGAATYRRFKHAEDFIELKARLREPKKRSVPAGEPDTKAPQAKTHKGATEATIMHGEFYFTKGMQTPTPQQQGTMVNIGQFCRSAPAPGMHNLVPANQVHPGSRMQTFVSPQSTQLGDGQGGSMHVAMALAQEKGRREQEERGKIDAVLHKFASGGGGGGHHGFGGGMGGM